MILASDTAEQLCKIDSLFSSYRNSATSATSEDVSMGECTNASASPHAKPYRRAFLRAKYCPCCSIIRYEIVVEMVAPHISSPRYYVAVANKRPEKAYLVRPFKNDIPSAKQ